MLKYGVVRMDDLVLDILNWERLYLSGRLQKPVCVLDFSISFHFLFYTYYHSFPFCSKASEYNLPE